MRSEAMKRVGAPRPQVDARGWGWATVGGALFVLVSSVLGLAGRVLPAAPGIMAAVWSSSLVADLVFTAGSLAVAALGFVWARRDWKLGLVAGLLGHWIVYTASFLLLPGNLSEDLRRGDALADRLVFVVEWGFLGLLFATVAPLGAQLLWDRKLGRPRAEA
jgi:hypothetical protein